MGLTNLTNFFNIIRKCSGQAKYSQLNYIEAYNSVRPLADNIEDIWRITDISQSCIHLK